MMCPVKNFKIQRAALALFLLSVLALLLPLSASATQSVTFGWEPSTDASVAGYNIYYGTVSQAYTSKVSVGNVTSATISGLVEGTTYYFAATTYDALNQESALSDEIDYTVPAVVVNQSPTITGLAATNSATVGQNVTFSVTASGTGPLTYQWMYNQNSMASATNAVLNLNNITAAQAGIYYVTVSNSIGSTNSTAINLVVNPTMAATLTAVPHLNGQFALNVSGVSNNQYVVQASTDLKNWVSVQTNTSPFTFVDSNASQFSQRFYRTYLALYPPTNAVSDITSGLVVYYPLAANGNDYASGNNLTLIGSPTFSSSAVNWNAAAITLGYSAPQQWPQSGLTVSAWINMTDPTANYVVATCYGNYNGSLGASYMQFFTSASGLTARMVQNMDINYIGRTTPASLTSGWHFATFTWSGGTASSSIKIYLDGTQIDNADSNGGNFTGVYAGSDIPLSLGAQFSNGYGVFGKFNGSQKGVRMYNRALSGSEINLLYANGISGGSF